MCIRDSGGGVLNKDLIVKNGRLYDDDLMNADDFLPENNPIVQHLMSLEGVREKFLFGYGDPPFLGTEPTEIPTAETVPVDSFIATDKFAQPYSPGKGSQRPFFGY